LWPPTNKVDAGRHKTCPYSATGILAAMFHGGCGALGANPNPNPTPNLIPIPMPAPGPAS